MNAWNMRGRGWLDESRVWKPGIDAGFDETIQLRPLHAHDLPGWLAAELPLNAGESGAGPYLVEFRTKAGWDAGIPRSAVLVHRLLDPAPAGGVDPKRSYIMSGTNGSQDLVAGDVFEPGGAADSRLQVLSIDENAQTATVRLHRPGTRWHYVYYVGGDNGIHLWFWDGASWADQTLGGSVLAGTSPSAYINGPDHLAYFVGSDNAIHLWFWDGTSWADQTLGGSVLPGTNPSSYFLVAG